jgi:predicted membrane protein
VFSFALLPVAMLPLLLHLQQPMRGIEVMMTPHFTSAIAAFGIVFTTYGVIVASELWFVYRQHFVRSAVALRSMTARTPGQTVMLWLFAALTLGAWDIGEHASEQDEKGVKFLAGLGIPVACFLHGYAGFIFGSVKANALWMTPLMPVIFICSAVVSGIALCILVYIGTISLRQAMLVWRRRADPALPDLEALRVSGRQVVTVTARYLRIFMVLAITLELLDLIFRGYTAVKSWDILRSVIYEKDFFKIFVLQYGLGNLVPFVLLLLPRLTVRRAVIASALVLLGVFMMRWNVVIGGQAFSSSLAGFMDYRLPIWPHDLETFKEGLFGAIFVAITPFVIFRLLIEVMPVFGNHGESDLNPKADAAP